MSEMLGKLLAEVPWTGILEFAIDIYLKAALAIYRKTSLYPIQLVHDELVYELATDDLNDTIDFICWKMKRVAEDLTGHIVPFPVEVK